MVGSDFIGDDLAQIWIEESNGTVRAINPESGIFGIVEDVNQEGDPYLIKRLREEGTEVIFSQRSDRREPEAPLGWRRGSDPREGN